MRSCRWALVLLVVTACGGSPGVDTQPTDVAPSSETVASSITVAPAPTATVSAETTTADTSTTTPTPTTSGAGSPGVVIADGEVVGPDSVDVTLGKETAFVVTSDVELELHVHGYDLVFEVGAGETVEIRFVADVPGIFEVETHPGHLMVVNIVVEP